MLKSAILLVIVLALSAACSSAARDTGGNDTASGSPSGGSSPTPTTVHHHKKRHHAKKPPSGIPRVDVPRSGLTPGATFAVGRRQICVSGYSASVRDVPESEKRAVYARYGVVHVAYMHEVDHLVSLELGGSNLITNLWPEPYAGRWGARTKDVLENRLHDLVCSGRLPLRRAQHIEATNWVAAYRRYVGGTPTAPSTGGSGGSAGTGTPTDPGGFYASSYGTASTIYCADDPGWRSLSKTYLRHFTTWARARAAHPGYHLHQPC